MTISIERRLEVMESMVAGVGHSVSLRMDDVDAQMGHLHDCMEDMKKKAALLSHDMSENTKLTRDIYAIARTFKLIGKAGVYVSGSVTGVVAVYQVVTWFFLGH